MLTTSSTEDIRKLTHDCRACPLGESKSWLVVPGEGVQNPDLMLVGEAPGEVESNPLLYTDSYGVPFVGPAGELLQQVLVEAGRTTQSLFVTNVLKHRPPYNRTPTEEEQVACQPFLAKQIELLKPKVILGLGRVATDTLCRLSEIEQLGVFASQQILYKKQIPTFFTYHPSYILRNPSKKNIMLEDIAWVIQYLETI